MQTTEEPFDFRLSNYARITEPMSSPQAYLADKVASTRYERTDEGVVYLYRADDIVRINRHPGILGEGGRGSAFGTPMPLIPLEIDGDDHAKWRRILDPLFAPKQVALLEDSVRALTGELIDGFADDDVVDMYAELCVPLPCITFLRVFGAPEEDLDFFLQFKDEMVHPKGETLEELQAVMKAAGLKIMEYFGELLTKRRAEPHREDVLGHLLTAEVDGQPVTDFELIHVMILLMFAGLDTVTSALSCMISYLAQHPEERRRVVADPTLVRGLVEELLRYESPVPVGTRYATEDIDLGDGLVIRAGEAILASWASANLDPKAHDDPMTINIDRPRHVHIAFASGTHRCLGSHLARLEMRLAIEELHKRVPEYEVPEGEEIRYINVPVRAAEHLPLRLVRRT